MHILGSGVQNNQSCANTEAHAPCARTPAAKYANSQRCTVSKGRCGRCFFSSPRLWKVEVLSASCRNGCLYPFHKQGGTHAHAHGHDTPACLHPPRAISLALSRTAPPPLHPLTSIEKINAIHYHHRREEIQGQKGAKRLASPLLTHSSRVVTSGAGGRALRSLKVGGAWEE